MASIVSPPPWCYIGAYPERVLGDKDRWQYSCTAKYGTTMRLGKTHYYKMGFMQDLELRSSTSSILDKILLDKNVLQ